MAFFSTLKKMRSGKIPSCSAVIAAGGCSQRMNGEDKLFAEIHGAPVLAHTLTAFQNCGYIDEIVIVTRGECIQSVSEICKRFGISKASKVIVGGATRLESVMNGLFAVSKKAELVAIHDGARPCVRQDVIRQAVETAAKYHAAAPAVPVSSTIKKAQRGIVINTVDRDDLFEIQTPQVFTADLIKAALTNANNKSIDITDDCKAVELLGASVHMTEGTQSNIKITTPEDLVIAEAVLQGAGSRE